MYCLEQVSGMKGALSHLKLLDHNNEFARFGFAQHYGMQEPIPNLFPPRGAGLARASSETAKAAMAQRERELRRGCCLLWQARRDATPRVALLGGT